VEEEDEAGCRSPNLHGRTAGSRADDKWETAQTGADARTGGPASEGGLLG